MAIYTLQYGHSLKGQGSTTLNLDEQIYQLATHQWMFRQRATKGDPFTCIGQCFQKTAAHCCQRAKSSPDTSEIDHLSHLHKATIQDANLIRPCSMQSDFACGE